MRFSVVLRNIYYIKGGILEVIRYIIEIFLKLFYKEGIVWDIKLEFDKFVVYVYCFILVNVLYIC